MGERWGKAKTCLACQGTGLIRKDEVCPNDFCEAGVVYTGDALSEPLTEFSRRIEWEELCSQLSEDSN